MSSEKSDVSIAFEQMPLSQAPENVVFFPKKILPELVQECMTGISVQTGGKLHLCSMERLDQPGDSSAGDLFGMVRKRDPNSKANRYITSNVRG